MYSLAFAKRHYKSLCLNGPGPNYAVIGTNRNDTITVSGTRQRVLGLGGADKITVKSGDQHLRRRRDPAMTQSSRQSRGPRLRRRRQRQDHGR